MASFPSAPSDAEIEALLHREKFKLEVKVREDVTALLASDEPGELTAKTAELVSKVSESSKNELVHYVALRKQLLQLLSGVLRSTLVVVISLRERFTASSFRPAPTTNPFHTMITIYGSLTSD